MTASTQFTPDASALHSQSCAETAPHRLTTDAFLSAVALIAARSAAHAATIAATRAAARQRLRQRLLDRFMPGLQDGPTAQVVLCKFEEQNCFAPPKTMTIVLN